ncbi:uncharacterized protein LOC131326966 isoform X1 [Rhododendron vialii]|uniref:uncharacterized protein LOC131326966 isoform X1 n=1 Tax=Rhododendron vialii TaxID=182163 RepID=UPI00265D8127|nr:uncharacterized protein LOC131326966 isoform X1 [Rhododendron vialii]
MGALLVYVSIKWGFYRKNKGPGESSSQRDVELSRQTGRARRSTLEKSNSLGAPDTTSRCYEKLAKATDYQAKLRGASDGDKNANTGSGVSTGATTMEGGISLGTSKIDAPVSIGNTIINNVYPMLAKSRGGASFGNTAVGGGGSILNMNTGGGGSIGDPNIEGG